MSKLKLKIKNDSCTRKATNENSKNENTKFNQDQSKLSQFFENSVDITHDRRTPSNDTPLQETSSKYFQPSNDNNETNESILDFRAENNKKLQTKLKCQTKTKKSKTKKSTNVKKNKKENLLRFTKNFEDVCTLGGIDVNPEHLQLAIALSLSLADSKGDKASLEDNSDEYVSSTPSTSQDNNNEEENVKRIRKTLDQYGFKVPSGPILLPSSRKILMDRKLSKSLIFIRTFEEKKQIVSNAVSQILFESQINTSECERIETELHSGFLDCVRSRQKLLYYKSSFDYCDMEDELDIFYVRNMVTPSESRVGCLLKDWSKIPGRDPSPEREFKNSDLADNDLFPDHLDILLSSSCSYIIEKISGMKNKSMSPEKRLSRSTTASPKKRLLENVNLDRSVPNFNSSPEKTSKTGNLDYESSTNVLNTQVRISGKSKNLCGENRILQIDNLEAKSFQNRPTSPEINIAQKESNYPQNISDSNTPINIPKINEMCVDISKMEDKSEMNHEKLTVIEIKSRSCSPDIFEDDSDCDNSFRNKKFANTDLPPKVVNESSDEELPDVFVSMSQNPRTPKKSQAIGETKLDVCDVNLQVIDLVDVDCCPRSSFNKTDSIVSMQSSIDLTLEEDIVKSCEENNEVNSEPIENIKLSRSISNYRPENFMFKSPSKIENDTEFQKGFDEIDSFVEDKNKTVCSSDESVADCLRKKRPNMSFGSIDDSVAFNKVLKDFKVNEKNCLKKGSESSMESIDLTSEKVCGTNFDVSRCRSFTQIYENDNGILHFESYHEGDGPLDISDDGSLVNDPTELHKNAKNVNDISATILESENNVSVLSDDDMFDNSQPYDDPKTFDGDNPTKPTDICNDSKIDLTQSSNSEHSFDTRNRNADSIHQIDTKIKNISVSDSLNDDIFYISDEEFNYSINTSRYKNDKQSHRDISMSVIDPVKSHSSFKKVNAEMKDKFPETHGVEMVDNVTYSYKKDKQYCNDISVSEDERDNPHSSIKNVRVCINEKFVGNPTIELDEEFNYSMNRSFNKIVKRNCNDISVSEDEQESSHSSIKKVCADMKEKFVEKHVRELNKEINNSCRSKNISVFKDGQESLRPNVKKAKPIRELDEEFNYSMNTLCDKKVKRNCNDISVSEDEQELSPISIKNISIDEETIIDEKPDTELNESNKYRISNRFDLYGSSLFDQIPSYRASLVNTPKLNHRKETSIVLDDIEINSLEENDDLPDVCLKKATNVHLKSVEKSLGLTNSIETPPNNKYIIKTDNVTPAQDYNKMDTPKIHKELAKFGLKPLKRKRAVQILQHIYDETHPLVDSNELEMKLKRRKVQCDPIPTISAQIEPFHQDIHWDKDENALCDRLVGRSPQKSQNYNNNECEGAVNNDIYVPDCKTIIIKSVDCNPEDWIFQTREKSKIHGCRVPLHIAFHNYLSIRSKLRAAILRYEPVNIDTIHKGLVAEGYRYNSKDLFQFMDKKCITIKTADKTGGSRQKKQ